MQCRACITKTPDFNDSRCSGIFVSAILLMDFQILV
jgi:hypothetical protein